MTPADVLSVLAEASLAASGAIAVVMLLRRAVRNTFGAGIAYATWAAVPLAAIAVLVPASTIVVAAPVQMPSAGSLAAVPEFGMAAGVSVAAVAVAAWALGVLATAVWLAAQQRRFVATLGPLRRRDDGLLQAASVAGLPAVVGLLQPRTIVPSDFDARYSPEQRRLLAEHERTHVARGDLWANALVGVLRCLWWFNPLVHAAAACYRHDQELACDQRVLARHPTARRAYGEAMFNTQLAAQLLPVGCHWGHGHPLKERIEMLKQPIPGVARRRAGVAGVLCLGTAVTLCAWAAQPPRVSTVPQGSAAPADLAAAPAGAGDAAALPTAAALSLPPPKYPASALEQRVEGKVVLLVDIDAAGNVVDAVVESADPPGVFEANALQAVEAWHFEPEMKDGEPVPSRVRVPVQFKMDPPQAPEATPESVAGG